METKTQEAVLNEKVLEKVRWSEDERTEVYSHSDAQKESQVCPKKVKAKIFQEWKDVLMQNRVLRRVKKKLEERWNEIIVASVQAGIAPEEMMTICEEVKNDAK